MLDGQVCRTLTVKMMSTEISAGGVLIRRVIAGFPGVFLSTVTSSNKEEIDLGLYLCIKTSLFKKNEFSFQRHLKAVTVNAWVQSLPLYLQAVQKT